MGTLPTIARVGHEVGLGRLRTLGLQVRVWWAKDRRTRELADRLTSPEPVCAHGMALALLLLTDTGQPLFGIGRASDLANAIIEARERLDAPSIEDAW